MKNNIINSYSSAFIDAIHEQKIDHEKVYNQMCEFEKAIRENIEYLDLLNSIAITNDTKKQLINELFSSNEYMKNMIYYMIDKNDQHLLLEIIKLIIHNLSKTLNIINLKITSAFALSSDQIKAICKKMEKKLNKKIVPNVIIDKSYIAGISVEYDSKIIDNSIKAKLNEIKANFK